MLRHPKPLLLPLLVLLGAAASAAGALRTRPRSRLPLADVLASCASPLLHTQMTDRWLR
jgi:hypothetical protein